jgi:hypothetical protein
MTVEELVREQREALVKAIHVCTVVAQAQEQLIRSGKVKNLRGAMAVHSQAVQTTHTLALVLRLAGVSVEDAMQVAQQADRERMAMDLLKGGHDA